MKNSITYFLTAFSVAGLLATAAAQTTEDADTNNAAPPPMENGETPPPMPPPDDAAPMPVMSDNNGAGDNNNSAATTTIIRPSETKATGSTVDASLSDFVPPTQSSDAGSDELRLNFRNAPLDMVLNYLSDAAGFIIVLDTQVHGNVSVISSHPMTRDEAVDLLNAVLNQNGYAAIRDGRTLTIVSKDDAKTRDIPVKTSNDPDSIPKNDEIVTQIIPIRFVEAADLVKDLASFVSPQATIVANEAGNSIVITDTQSNIRHLVEIIKAIDTSAESETEIRVFRLKYANPNDVATLLSDLFQSSSGSSSGNNNQSPIRFGGFGGFGGFGRGGGGGGGGSSTSGGASDRIKKAQQVIAVADARTSSVVVTAAKDLMDQIAGMMEQLDVSSERDQKVYVFHMNNGDPQQAVQVLQSMFQSSTSSRSSSSSSSTTSALMTREQQNASSSSTSVSGSSSSSGGFGSSGGGGGFGGGR